MKTTLMTTFMTIAMSTTTMAQADNSVNVECYTNNAVIRLNMDNPAGSSNILAPSQVRLVSWKSSFSDGKNINFKNLPAKQMYLKKEDDPHYGYGDALSAIFVDENQNLVADFDASSEKIIINGLASRGKCMLPTGE